MFLLILDKDPIRSAHLIPDKLKFKQLIELGQLVCSAGISDVYKPIKQGKQLQEWIKNNPEWTYFYMNALNDDCGHIVNMRGNTRLDILNILASLLLTCNDRLHYDIKTGVFRYSKDFEWFTKHPTNTELPIKECIKEYKKYVEWKKLKGVKGYV